MKIVLMIGQSNMAGRGFLNEVPPILPEWARLLRLQKNGVKRIKRCSVSKKIWHSLL